MALQDTVRVPLSFSNETSKAMEAKVTIQLPNTVKLVHPYPKTIAIAAKSTSVQYIDLIPIKKVDKDTIIAVATDKFNDRVAQEITVISPYFPKQVSFSGTQSNTFEIPIQSPVSGSVKANFTLYTDIIGEVMDGIEGIIREPYGCFEQVSSSTYPNILVLQYLRATGKSNPKIEKKALNFIRKGYKKLAGYETAKNGFEWYGKAPPHEALTAYGLMEFTEMKAVYDGVSEPMLQRTIDYLHSRKDGKGGFQQNRGKYGFSAAPKHINNAYIVYTMSASGIASEISKEYEATYAEALASNDSYRMALMACASDHLGKTVQTQELLQHIKQNIRTYGFGTLPVEHTITRSYGNAKQIETVAFSVLALLRDENKEYPLIAEGIEYLLSQRKYGRFGSTQSTAMALKALITYTKDQKAKRIASTDHAELMINGKTIKKIALNDAIQGKIVLDSLAPYLTNGKQRIQVAFSNPEMTFPYAFNVTYDSFLPASSEASPFMLRTSIADTTAVVGDNVSLAIEVTNTRK